MSDAVYFDNLPLGKIELTNFDKYIYRILDSNELSKCTVFELRSNRERCDENCYECMKASKAWLSQEYKESYKLSRLEYEILKDIKKRGTNTVAKAKNGRDLFAIYAKSKEIIFECSSCFHFIEAGVEYKIDDILSNCEILEEADFKLLK